MTAFGAAIIGCGAIAPLHANAIASMEWARLVAAADPDAGQASAFGTLYGCGTVPDYHELLERKDIDVVHLCTPHFLHAQMAIDCLNAGKHVLTEKPLATDVPSARRIIEAADRSKGQLGVVFQNRYNEPSQRIRRIIDSGELGQLVCMKAVVTWHRSEQYYTESGWRGKWATEGGGVLINQTIHTLDLLQWFGGEIASVKGKVSTDVLDDVIEVEDSAHACITFADGVRGLFYGTNAYPVNSPVELELVFERGTLLQRRDCLYLWKDGREQLLCEPGTVTNGGKSYWGTGHQWLIQDFYRYLNDKRKFWLDGREGIKALEVIAAIYRSSGGETAPVPAGTLRSN
ncbi:oxidoreductase [Paenibacillus sp. FSL R7-0273]|uniref:Gfo/Idh/MocA family protein n=1 Tax=Paenibacillus sp. FSL R7-0273 TaxID=1536772 RepID=UPI0004F6D302|nr:Gfo/Idh/MocA family oxidoreductase [Paenibacillus sp. FSL R7-0273]AIQ47091.1 oxidoreductase [Paenibacillus sp. FSL R7-0273]OMF97156.1 oxidoreductase [Paenibacillus sp. FSL R7-0273]